MATGSSTVQKALDLLDFFGEQRATIGLSDLAKLSGFNKATTLRHLSALEAKGFVEQDPATRLYNLGPAFLRFAQIREARFPLQQLVNKVLCGLQETTGETALASVLTGKTLAILETVESHQANRVILETGKPLPFHATASGLAYLAFASEAFKNALLQQALVAHTQGTTTDRAEIAAKLEQIRASGVACVSGDFEEGVVGIAAPFFGPDGAIYGAVAAALPVSRASAEKRASIESAVRSAGRALTDLRGGVAPKGFPA